MLEKNRVYPAEIVDYTAEGQGVARIEGCAVFVPNAIVGERCTVRILKTGKTWAAGKMEYLSVPSPHRVERACPVGKRCGGCDFQHMDYEEECRLKAARVRDTMNRLADAGLERVELLPAPEIAAYRNKAVYPVASVRGRPAAGFYQAGTHQLVQTPRCAIQPREADRCREIVLRYMEACGIPAYDETTGRGLVRSIFVRRAVATGQVLLCLAVNGSELPQWQALDRQLRAEISGFATLVLSVHTRPGNAVLGTEFRVLSGPGWIEDVLCGLRFRLSARSFYQVNHNQAERLYQEAIRLAGIRKSDTVLDLYCGAGTITLCMASAAGRVIGVEVVPEAVEDARENARRNGVTNAEFFCGDAGEAARMLADQGVRPDVAVVDPPRKGLNGQVVETLCSMAPQRVVYVSCDPATLARDVARFRLHGYSLSHVLAVDMFPRCAHVETVVLLSQETNPLTV